MKNFMAINKFIEPERPRLSRKEMGIDDAYSPFQRKFKVDYDYSDMTEKRLRPKEGLEKEISRLATNGLGNHRKATRAYSSSARVVGNVSTSAFFGSHANPCSTFLGE